MEASSAGQHCPLTLPEHTASHLRLGLALLEADRPHEARVALQGASPCDEATVDPTAIPLQHWALAYSSWLVGRWDSAVIEVQAGLAAAEADGAALHGVAWAGVGVVVAIHRDDLLAARGLLSRVQRQLVADTAACPLWSQGAEALLVEAEGQPDVALKVMADGWDRAGPARHLSAYRLFGPELVRLALSHGDRRRAASVAEEIEESAGRLSASGARGAVLRCRGLLADDPGVLLRAVDALREAPRALELASACEQAAASLQRSGRASLASSLLGQALSAYRSLGATRDLARIAGAISPGDDAVVAAGPKRPSPPGRRTSGGVGGAQLSGRELEVLELLMAGIGTRAIAERLFLSHHTVRNHAQSILRKLGVHSRLEAVSVARREGFQPPNAPEPSAD